MTKRRFSVGHSRADGFFVVLEEYSPSREFVSIALDKLLCWNHHFGWQFDLCQKLGEWEFKAERTLAHLPIDRKLAEELSEPGTWDWVSED